MTINLFHENCINVLTKMEENSVDLILTDPPYNLGNFMRNRQTNLKKMRSNYFGAAGWDDLDFIDWQKNMETFFEKASRVLRKGGAMIIFMSIIKVESIINIAEKYGFYYKTTGIWHKRNPMPRNMDLHFVNSTEAWIYFTYKVKTSMFNNNGKVLHDFVETSVTPANERKFGKHPTQKPISLMEYFIKVLSNEGDLILDPFMGSGTVGVASKKLKRNFIGIEISKEYFSISKNRIENIDSYES